MGRYVSVDRWSVEQVGINLIGDFSSILLSGPCSLSCVDMFVTHDETFM